MLKLNDVKSGQFCAFIWQFHVVPLDLWVTHLTDEGNNIGGDLNARQKTPIYIYIHTDRSIHAQINMLIDSKRCIYIYIQLVYKTKYMYIWFNIVDVQQSMHLHLFAPICTYSAFKKHANKQINMGNNIYIYIACIYVFKAQYIYIYVYIYAYIVIYTLAHQESCIKIYIYIYICSAKPQIIACKPLALQEAAVSTT